MVTMSNFGSNGRLGNQLYQWAFISSLSRKMNTSYVLPKWHYRDFFKGKPNEGQATGQVIAERSYTYMDYSDLDFSKDLDFTGYFQNEKYFDDQVMKDIQFTDEYAQTVKDKFQVFDRPTIAIGIRRTDYLKEPLVYHQLSINYYITALELIDNWRDYNLIFISDDLPYCKFHFGCLENAYFPETSDIEQLCLASLCDHWIIGNSTFHWWAAKIGEKPHSKVIQPTKLFAGKLLEKYGDVNFYSDRWLKHEEKKIDLSDVTFTIPVFFDHPDRKFNLDLCITILNKHFDTNIIVGEQGDEKFKYTSEWVKYVKFDYDTFHRTKMLNEMAKLSRTPFIANWDCDVLIPPMQMVQVAYYLRLGAQMVYPYDGVFHRIKEGKNRIFPSYDIGVFYSDKPNGTPSYGGAVLWNRRTFFEIGGENEYMVSFGPEDSERYERAKLLGVNIKRVKGDLYHIDHWCGPDSSTANPFFRRNRDLYQVEKAMDEKQLRKYISSWPWYSPYTEDYYTEISEEAIVSAKEVLGVLGITNQSVIDIGCGVGEWNNGNPNYTGVDYRIPKDKLLIPKERFIECDLEKNTVKGKYDYCLCLEVAEHISEDRADELVKMLCELSDVIIFSAAIPYQGGNGHINEQFQSYWIEKFNKHGFRGFRNESIVSNEKVALWYRQNLIEFVRGSKVPPAYDEVLAGDFVLPEYYLQIAKHLKG